MRQPSRVGFESDRSCAAPRAVAPGLAVLCALLLANSPVRAESDNFESPPVHPVELSADGTRLFVTNLADGRLVVFDLRSGEPTRVAEIPVGLEPVTVRARTDDEVWVVNHVSDSVSIVDLVSGLVVRTLLVGDEPTDVVFAGSPPRAFVCVSEEDRLAVYDPAELEAAPVSIPLPATDPRSLAVSSDGASVYVAAFDSQNRTSVVSADAVVAGGGLPPPHPPMDPALPLPRKTALIVRHDGSHWVDELDRIWDSYLPARPLDYDVFRVSSASLSIVSSYSGVGTNLFNIAVHPIDGRLFVTNQEAENAVRFEPNLSGRFAQCRVTVIDPATGSVTPRHLNPHIDYDLPHGSDSERARSLALPLDVAVHPDGQEVYVAAFGSRKVGVLDANGQITRRLHVGQGPCGLAVDAPRHRLYVYNRFNSTLSVVDLDDDSSHELPLGFDPTPFARREGRHYLYDGQLSSAHGDLACASCHLFAADDGLAWDLGNPRGVFVPGDGADFRGYHPMKGPMITQALKGLEDTEPFHWRGDRTTFFDFLPAFQSLMGRGEPFPREDMESLFDFLLSIRYPPNPKLRIDGGYPDPPGGPSAERGRKLFVAGKVFGENNCASCHTLPTGESGQVIPPKNYIGDQDMKVPQLRNLYEKTGFTPNEPTTVRGFGFSHDGTFGSIMDYLRLPIFNFETEDDARDVEAFLLAFDSMSPPSIGQQGTMRDDGVEHRFSEDRTRLLQVLKVADQALCGAIAKGKDASGDTRGWTYVTGDRWISDRASEAALRTANLLELVGPGSELTWTGVVTGTETRLGIDHDLDGFRDRDELDAGSDPSDPESTPARPAGLADLGSPKGELRLELVSRNPAVTSAEFAIAAPPDSPRGGIRTRLDVLDLQGRRVRRILDEGDGVGAAHANWDLRDERGSRVPRGVYFVRLSAGPRAVTARVVVH